VFREQPLRRRCLGEDLRFIPAVPTLGTGKVDLRRVRDVATQIVA
jgi:hypothetical protein